MNAYKVLDLPPKATKAEIRAAYRSLARRWHPDRFPEGPERDWANEKMAQINAAYHNCLKDTEISVMQDDETHALLRIQEMIDTGDYHRARSMLMNVSTRCAEWNYLFGAVLTKMCEHQKALIYLRVAAHQRPDVEKYAEALKKAESMRRMRGRLSTLLHYRTK